MHLLYNALTHWHSLQILHDLTFQKKSFTTRRILSYLIGLHVKLTCFKCHHASIWQLCIYSTMHWHIDTHFKYSMTWRFKKKFHYQRILSYLIGLHVKLTCFKCYHASIWQLCIYSTMHWHIDTHFKYSMTWRFKKKTSLPGGFWVIWLVYK